MKEEEEKLGNNMETRKTKQAMERTLTKPRQGTTPRFGWL